MPIIEQNWNKWAEKSEDVYSNYCVDVAKEIMRLLDTPEYQEFDAHKIICDANNNIKTESIIGAPTFMVALIVAIVTQCHSRGEEFKTKWNKLWDDKPREDVINPAIMEIKEKENLKTKGD